MTRRSGLFLVAGLLAAASMAVGFVGGLWALFVTVGVRTSSTRSMLAYNLSDIRLALIAYGPLLLAVLMLVAALFVAIAGLATR